MCKILTALQALVVMLGLVTALTLQAGPSGHYRWTDENGTIQYADRPPEGVKSEFIKFSGTRAPRAGEKKKAEEQASQEPETYDKMEVLPEKDPKLCQQAQSNLKALEAARIRITEPDGSKRFLSEDEKEGQRENARKFIKLHCD